MSVSGIESIGFTPLATPQLDAASGVKNATSAAPAADGGEFGNLVLDGIDRLQGVQQTSDQLAVKAATGDLDALHHYTIAATEAAVTTQLTVAVRNKAIDAFNEIMRMPV
jgi:flagellar hook-basal body complex protein FliE